MRASVAFLLLLLVGACAEATAPAARPTSAPLASTMTAGPEPQPRVVPDVRGQSIAEATRALEAVGLSVDEFWAGDATCGGGGIVVRQRPRAGRRADPERRATVWSDRLPCRPLERTTRVDEADTTRADAFVAFARDEGATPVIADRVAFYLGGGLAGQLDTSRVDARSAWRVCPPEGFYAAGSCPFDMLQVLEYAAINDLPLVYTNEPRVGVCVIESTRTDLPALAHLHRVVVSPGAAGATCATDFALELYYDGERLAAVNMSLSEP